MAVFNLDYYNQVDSYSDGDIEDVLLSYVKGETDWEQISKEENLYPVLYHLSVLRENILNWYPFSQDASVLEIGSGCGALTGLLCRKAKKVVSVELSKRRASINYERHKEKDNLEIMVGNLNDMNFDGSFDYVVLNGVLEYAMSFTKGEKPYETFLNSMKRFLKPEGHFLIAIENRLGLKYFNGAPEDHTGHYFEGIDRYRNNDTVRTFSKTELTALLLTCGLTAQKFYYPYPDYKFPTEIFTDETILQYGYGKSFVNLDENRYRIFEERELWNTLSAEKVTASFANSFLVDASLEKTASKKEIRYVKLNNDRKPCFRIATSIERQENETVVVKSPLTEEAKAHIQSVFESAELTPEPGFVNLKGELQADGSICYPFLTSSNLDGEIKKLIEDRQVDRIIQVLHQVFDEYGKGAVVRDDFQTAAFRRLFGPAELPMALPCVRPANIDLICDNIFEEDGRYLIIDCEWVFDMPIPMTFIIWRSVNELYTKHQKLQQLIDRKRLLLEFDIDDRMSGAFWEWATYFAKQYTGSSQIEQYVKPMEHLSIDDVIMQKRREKMLCSSLYYDLGDGFFEEQKLYSEVCMKQEHFSILYDLREIQKKAAEDGKEIKKLRWDPTEGVASICRLTCVDGAEAIAKNADLEEQDQQVFLTTDPVYLLEAEEIPECIRIEGTLHPFDGPELAAYIGDRLPILQWQSDTLEGSLKRQQEEITRLEEKLEELSSVCRQVSSEKDNLEQQHNRLIGEFGDLRKEYEQAVKEIEEIHASRSWRLLNKLKGN